MRQPNGRQRRSPDSCSCQCGFCPRRLRLTAYHWLANTTLGFWIPNTQSCWAGRRVQTMAVLRNMLQECGVFGSYTESLDPRQSTARLIGADGWKVSDSCAEVDRTPDYKSVGESGLLSALLSISTPTLQCKLFNMKNGVLLMMTMNHRMPLEGPFFIGSSFLLAGPLLTVAA